MEYDFSHVGTLPLSRGGGSSSGSDGLSFISRIGTSPIRPRTSSNAIPQMQGDDAITVETSSIDTIRMLEKQIDALLDESVLLKLEKNYEEALEKAKEAVAKEQLMRKHDNSRGELMFSTLFNLASTYELNTMYTKAQKTYATFFTKQRRHPFAGRIRISMGNSYYNQHDYASALACYEMALDQLSKEEDVVIRSKLRWNIGNALFRSGRLSEAMRSYFDAIDLSPDYQTVTRAGFNLFLCHYAMGKEDSMKQDLAILANVHVDEILEDGLYLLEPINEGTNHQPCVHLSAQDRLLLTAARLLLSLMNGCVAPDTSHDLIYNILEENHAEVVSHLELEQATQMLMSKDFDTATQMLKELQEKHGTAAMTNLSFTSFLAGDSDEARKYADNAVTADRHNAKALVNKANCLFLDGDFRAAKAIYLESIDTESDCFESIYCFALLQLSQGDAENALLAFEKLHNLTPNNPEVIHQIADIFDLRGRVKEAIKWFSVLVARVPNDPRTLSRLGHLYSNVSENPQDALHFKLESFRNFPLDIELIIELGSTFVREMMYSKSVFFFQQAALVEPGEVKWGLMIASALRRFEEYESALREYETLLKRFPDNNECKRNIKNLRQKLSIAKGMSSSINLI